MNTQEAYKTLDLAKGLGMDRVEAQFTKLKAEMESKMVSTSNERLKQVYSNRLNEIEEAYATLIESLQGGSGHVHERVEIVPDQSLSTPTKPSNPKWLWPVALIFVGIVGLIALFLFLNANSENNVQTEESINGIENNSTDNQYTESEDVDTRYLKITTISPESLNKIVWSKLIWSNRNEDLNGDGVNDKIEILGTKEYLLDKEDEPYQYILKVCINDNCFDQKVNFSAKSYYGTKTTFKVVDVIKDDKYKELLISYKVGTEEDPSFNHSLVRLTGMATLSVSELMSVGYSNGQIDFMNDGSFTVVHDRFPEIKGIYTLGSTHIKQIKLQQELENSEVNSLNGIFPEASQRKLTDLEVMNLSKRELKIMRNEIFARHGYIFKTNDMNQYFGEQNWYVPRLNDVTDKLTKIEKENIQLIKKYE